MVLVMSDNTVTIPQRKYWLRTSEGIDDFQRAPKFMYAHNNPGLLMAYGLGYSYGTEIGFVEKRDRQAVLDELQEAIQADAPNDVVIIDVRRYETEME